jgi:hypothetical protein
MVDTLLAMTRRYRRGRIGTYWLCKVLPKGLWTAAGHHTLETPLGTKNAARARRLRPPS